MSENNQIVDPGFELADFIGQDPGQAQAPDVVQPGNRQQSQPTQDQTWVSGFKDLLEYILPKFAWLNYSLFLVVTTNTLAFIILLLGSGIVKSGDPSVAEITLVGLWVVFYICLVYHGYVHSNSPFRREYGICPNLLYYTCWLWLVAAGLLIVFSILLAIYVAITQSFPMEYLKLFWPLPPSSLPIGFSLFTEFTYLCLYLRIHEAMPPYRVVAQEAQA